MAGCASLLLGYLMRRAKRILANTSQNHGDKFYSHSLLTITLQMVVAYDEARKFARTWCDDSNPNLLVDQVVALKEIFEAEDEDDMVWMMERLTNKYANENIDGLLYIATKR
jgi:hypothetical protein